MLLNVKRPRRAFMNVVIAFAGDVSSALERIASAYRATRYGVGETGFPNDDGGLTDDDSPTLSRIIRWADGRDVALHWKLPSPGS